MCSKCMGVKSVNFSEWRLGDVCRNTNKNIFYRKSVILTDLSLIQVLKVIKVAAFLIPGENIAESMLAQFFHAIYPKN